MSTLTDYITGLSGCVGCWPLDEIVSSTTLADLGPNGLTGTEITNNVSRNALGGTGFVTGHARCWQGSATEARGFQLATAANTLTQLQTYSLGVFYKYSGTTNLQYGIGRQNGWRLGTVTSFFKLYAHTGVTGDPNRTGNADNMTAGTPHLLGTTYDQQEFQPWLDGEREGTASPLTASLASFTNRVVVGGDTGMTNGGSLLSVAFIFNRVLLPGEWAQIYVLGLGQRTSDHAANFDFTGDGIPVIAASAEDERCYGCGGRRRVQEGFVLHSSSGRKFHLSCYGAQGRGLANPAAPLTAASSDYQIDVAHSRLIESVLDEYTKRPTTDKVRYEQADGRLIGAVTWQTMSANYGGTIGGLGVLHQRWGGGSHGPFMKRVQNLMAQLRATQIVAGETKSGWFSNDGTFATEWGGNGNFSLSALLPAVLSLWHFADTATRTLWLDTLRKACQALWDWETASYYANGNVQLEIWGIHRKMAVLDPSGPWMTYAVAHRDHMIRPTTGRTAWNGDATVGRAYLGLKQYVDGTVANDPFITLTDLRAMSDTTGKAYLAEGGTTSPTISYPGLDWNYCSAQCGFAAEIYLSTGDTDALKIAQVTANVYRPRLNLSNNTITGPSGSSVPPWWADFTGGTRHNAVEVSGNTPMLVMRRLGRTDLMTAQQLADLHVFNQKNAVTNTTSQAVGYREAGFQGASLESSSLWPEHPVIS